jgi:hypothetical protein
MVKECKICHIEKPIEEYHKKQNGLFGRTELCKSCKKEKDKRRWEGLSKEDKETKNKLAREYYFRKKLESPTFRKEDKERARVRKRNYRVSNELVQLKETVRHRIYKYLKESGYNKNLKTFEIVGITPEKLKEYIGNQFSDGMSWDNHGEWHIDHIIPLSSAKNESDLYKLFHYTNLQPLWAFDNLSKGNKVIG